MTNPSRNGQLVRGHHPGMRPTVAQLSRAAIASAVMTSSQRVEMAITGRPPSDFPARVIERIVGRPVPPGVSTAAVVHLAQLTLAAVAVCGAAGTRRVPTIVAIPACAAALVVGDAVLATAVGAADPPWRWTLRELATDVLHKSVLATTSRHLVRTRASSADVS